MAPPAGAPVRYGGLEPSWVEPGAVFSWSDGDRPLRVPLHDGDVVMYDAWWPQPGDWDLANLEGAKRKRVSYYVVATRVLAEKAKAGCPPSTSGAQSRLTG